MVGGEPPSGREEFQTMEELREREPLSIMEMKSSHAALSNLGKRKEWREEMEESGFNHVAFFKTARVFAYLANP